MLLFLSLGRRLFFIAIDILLGTFEKGKHFGYLSFVKKKKKICIIINTSCTTELKETEGCQTFSEERIQFEEDTSAVHEEQENFSENIDRETFTETQLTQENGENFAEMEECIQVEEDTFGIHEVQDKNFSELEETFRIERETSDETREG